jgi:hypothetical protein
MEDKSYLPWGSMTATDEPTAEITRANLPDALALIDAKELLTPKFYSFLEGNYEQDVEGQWWFQERSRKFSFLCPSGFKAMRTRNPDHIAAWQAEMKERLDAQAEMPWVKSNGPFRR